MSAERIQALRQFIQQRPDDPFPRYALAMEHKGAGDLEAAADAFRELSTRAPTYVATYLQFGMVLEQIGRTDEARAAFTQGITQARAAGNSHALSELTSALEGLG